MRLVSSQKYYQSKDSRVNESELEEIFGSFWEVNDFPVTVSHKPGMKKRFLLYSESIDLDSFEGDGSPNAILRFSNSGSSIFHYMADDSPEDVEEGMDNFNLQLKKSIS